MIILRQKSFTSRATKELRKKILRELGDVQEYSKVGKIFKRKVKKSEADLAKEYAEAAKKRFGRGTWNSSHGHYPSGKSWKARTDLPGKLSDTYLKSEGTVGSPNLMERITDKGILENRRNDYRAHLKELRKDKKRGWSEEWLELEKQRTQNHDISRSPIPFEERKKRSIKAHEDFIKFRDEIIKANDHGTPWRYPRPERRGS